MGVPSLMTSEKATAALIVELRAIAQVLEVEPSTVPAASFLRRIKVVSTLAADVLEEDAHVQ